MNAVVYESSRHMSLDHLWIIAHQIATLQKIT